MTKTESINCMRGPHPTVIFLVRCSDHVRLNISQPSVTLTPSEAVALAKKLRRMAAFIQGEGEE
jgi:hypothetical protein